MKDLSVIITSFQRSELLKLGLNSYLKQDLNFPYEVIVVNDGTEDETESVCNEFKNKLNIKYIFTGQRNRETIKWRVSSVAINTGVKLAEGKNIIISCSEIYLLTNCLKKVSDTLTIHPNGIIITEGKDDLRSNFLNCIKNNQEDLDYKIYRHLRPLNTELPFFMGITKSKFDELGGYDEDFIGYCWEDVDFVDRLITSGCYFVKINEKIVHMFHSRNRINLINKNQAWLFNQKMFYDRKGIIKRN